MPCLFKHSSRDTMFTLVVDDFGIKYKTPDDAEHLIMCLQLLYEIKVDKTGSRYLGFTIVFDDAEQTVSLSMPDYIPKLLERFFSDQVLRGQPTPAKYEPFIYGSDGQKVKRTDAAPHSPPPKSFVCKRSWGPFYSMRAQWIAPC